MNYILDSDIIIYLGKGLGGIKNQILKKSKDQLHTTIINHSELYYGLYNSQMFKQNYQKLQELLSNVKPPLPYCQKSSILFAEIKASLRKSGKIIGDMDIMIAAICIVNNMILVTNNTRDFKRIKGLKLENWV